MRCAPSGCSRVELTPPPPSPQDGYCKRTDWLKRNIPYSGHLIFAFCGHPHTYSNSGEGASDIRLRLQWFRTSYSTMLDVRHVILELICERGALKREVRSEERRATLRTGYGCSSVGVAAKTGNQFLSPLWLLLLKVVVNSFFSFR